MHDSIVCKCVVVYSVFLCKIKKNTIIIIFVKGGTKFLLHILIKGRVRVGDWQANAVAT